MLEKYAAWTEGAQAADIEAIQRAIQAAPQRVSQSLAMVIKVATLGAPSNPLKAPRAGSRLAVAHPTKAGVSLSAVTWALSPGQPTKYAYR